MPHTFKKHWIIFRELDTNISIQINLPLGIITKGWLEEKMFELDLTKGRPYLIIEEDEETWLILTLTKNPKTNKPKKDEKAEKNNPAFGRFGVINCPCLDFDSYVRLETKIIITKEFVEKFKLKLEPSSHKKHQCLTEEQFLELRESLDAYWNKENIELITVRLGIDSNNPKAKKRKNIKRKSDSLVSD